MHAAPATSLANFASGSVGVATANTAGGITENISVTGVTIAGNEFIGGNFAVTHNGAVVDGTSFGTGANGMFYGYDTGTGGPDESCLRVARLMSLIDILITALRWLFYRTLLGGCDAN
jgi:hypothetical protein